MLKSTGNLLGFIGRLPVLRDFHKMMMTLLTFAYFVDWAPEVSSLYHGVLFQVSCLPWSR